MIVDSALFRSHGLSAEDETLIVHTLVRLPTYAELGVFGVLWSEHCSYRTTRPLLATLPTTGPAVVFGPGENAGVLDVGDGLAVVFKIESHNHPSQIVPFHGAATGVGGILRDVFTMGARPFAIGVALRLGPRDEPLSAARAQGIAAGIGAYGNAIGVPTVTTDIGFDAAFRDNVLVNAFACGLVRRDRLVRGRAEPVGAHVVLLGSPTGRDGIHGATMASASFGEEAPRQHTVQVGDPFAGKRLLEACVALADARLVTGMQDLGAAGLSSSTVEMAARAGTGLELWLGRVPRRAEGMSAYEVLLSESQERMIAVCTPDRLAEVQAVAAFHEIACTVIGKVTGSGRWIVREGDEDGPIACDLDVELLAHGAPERTFARARSEPRPACVREIPRDLVQQWDGTVGGESELEKESDAASLRVRANVAEGPIEKRLVLALGAPRGRPAGREIGFSAVVEACLRIAAVGARPLGLSDGLNFGSPQAPAIMDELAWAIAGLGEAARLFGVPIVSGNVSLSNQTYERAIPPTPMVVGVGLLAPAALSARARFDAEGLGIWLVVASRERDLPALVELLVALGEARVERVVHVITDGDVARALAHLSTRLDPVDPAFRAVVAPTASDPPFAGGVLVATRAPAFEARLAETGLLWRKLGVTGAVETGLTHAARWPAPGHTPRNRPWDRTGTPGDPRGGVRQPS